MLHVAGYSYGLSETTMIYSYFRGDSEAQTLRGLGGFSASMCIYQRRILSLKRARSSR